MEWYSLLLLLRLLLAAAAFLHCDTLLVHISRETLQTNLACTGSVWWLRVRVVILWMAVSGRCCM